MRSLALVLPFAILSACEAEPPDTQPPTEREIGESLAQDYAAAACRLYVEEACALGAEDACGQELGFEDRHDCEQVIWWSFLGAQEGLFEALAAEEATVQGCIDLLDAVDCDAEAPCAEDGSYVFDQGDCGAFETLVAEYLPGYHAI
jgi:hypothetical protein